MLPTLEHSEKFTKEFNSFQERINKVTNENLKTELVTLLNKLLREVRSIDQAHQEMMLSRRISESVTDSRNAITEIRRSIFSRLEDWDRAVASQQV